MSCSGNVSWAHLLALAHNDRVQQVGLVPQVRERSGDAVGKKDQFYTFSTTSHTSYHKEHLVGF